MGGLRDVVGGHRVLAAVSDHIGEAVRRRGMVKMRCGEFATPTPEISEPAQVRSISSVWSEQITVVAAHHGKAGARKTDDRVAQGRCLPGF